jgi:hypothetical protein
MKGGGFGQVEYGFDQIVSSPDVVLGAPLIMVCAMPCSRSRSFRKLSVD